MASESLEADDGPVFEELNLLDYWLLLRKHAKQILTLAFLVTLLAALVAFSITPVYRSTALLLLENSKTKALSLSDLYDIQGAGGQEAFNSQVQILKSRPIAETVIEKLDLFNVGLLNPPVADGWFASAPIGTPSEIQARRYEALLGKFSNNLTIEPILKSQIVKVSFDSPDAELSARVANAVADVYIEKDLESRSMMTQRANMWLTDRLKGLREKLEESEQALQQYREQENIVDTKGVVLSGSAKQLEEISTNLIAARQRLSEAESAYSQVRNYGGESIEDMQSLPAVLKSTSVQRMKEVESLASQKLNELKSRYTAAHPKVIAAESELNSARAAVRREVQAVVKGITKEYELANANVAANSRALDRIKTDIQKLGRKEFKLSVLMRDVESNKQLYDLFVSRAKETDVATNLQSTAGHVVDPAVVSGTPLKPKKLQIIGIALVLGLLVGVGLVLMMDYLDSTMHSVADVERRLGMEVLGSVQTLDHEIDEPGELAHAYLLDQNTPFAESVRTLRTAVLLSAIDEPHRVVMITSTVPGEGKTTIATNLAYALGQMKKVLIIDGDIRRPGLSTAIGGLEGAMGLVDYLAEEAALKDCIHETDSDHVFVLPAGQRFNSPLEFLSSQRFGETIDKLKQLFDVVIIDCPPLKPVSDSLVISRYASAVLFVVKADTTPHQLAGSAIKRLLAINAPLLGVVLAQVDHKQTDYYGHYSDLYNYTYGRQQNKPARTFLGIKI